MKVLVKSILLTSIPLCFQCTGKNHKNAELIFGAGDSSKRAFIKTEAKNVDRLKLEIQGRIDGSGQLSIGENDSIPYKTYEIQNGKIEVKYDGDWYSQFCYVTFKSKSQPKGKIKIVGDFYGE